jgi:PhzF family phenazine biosynthesis protein
VQKFATGRAEIKRRSEVRIFQVDAFTTARFTGNPATVVLDADGTGEATMKSVAREFSHAEVAFVSAPDAADHDVRLRFFNSRKEAPFVGHATIAAHAVLLAVGDRKPGVWRQHSGTGIMPVSAQVQDSRVTVEFRQAAPELDVPMPLKTTLRVAEALRLPATHLHELMPARVARRGSTRLLVPVSRPEHLNDLAPNFETLVSLGTELGADGFFVFALNDGDEGMSTQSRMFCPALGIPEDPVSGNAHAMLAAYLWDLGAFDDRPLSFLGQQGRQMGRPGEVHVRLEVRDGEMQAAHIGGAAVIVSEGTLAL